MTAREVLTQVQARAAAATHGPWAALPLNQCCLMGYCVETADQTHSVVHNAETTRADVEFIASARTDVPRLAAALVAVLDLADNARAEDDVVPVQRLQEAITAALRGDVVRTPLAEQGMTDPLDRDRGETNPRTQRGLTVDRDDPGLIDRLNEVLHLHCRIVPERVTMCGCGAVVPGATGHVARAVLAALGGDDR